MFGITMEEKIKAGEKGIPYIDKNNSVSYLLMYEWLGNENLLHIMMIKTDGLLGLKKIVEFRWIYYESLLFIYKVIMNLVSL